MLFRSKEAKITVTGSSNLSKEEIERMVQEAAANAEADKKQKEKAEKRNSADNLIYNTEKTVNDLGDKIEETEKEEINAKVTAMRDLLDGEGEEFDKAFEELQSASFALAQKLYQSQQNDAEQETSEDIIDAEVVND